MKTLLISDLHLSPERPAVTNAFKRFLSEQAAHCDGLYILGDLFDVWVGDDDPAPLPREIIDELRVFTDRGGRLYIMHGNRDFGLGKRFARETGCSLLKDHHVVDLYGHKVLLLHGDTLCTEDHDYQRARRIIRNPLLIEIMRCFPLKIRQQIGIRARASSQAATGKKNDYIMDISQQAVQSTLNKYDVTAMVHGHTHRPGRHEIDLNGVAAQRIVLGDWHDKGWVVEASANGLELISFGI